MRLIASILLSFTVVSASPRGHLPPPGPHGPVGLIEKYDLLKPTNGGRLGAFNTVDWDPGFVNEEVQYYKSENAVQDPTTGEITITAERRENGDVVSAR